MNAQEAYEAQRRLMHIDTDPRLAFCQGMRHALTVILDAPEDDDLSDVLLALNEDIVAFGKEIVGT